MVQNFIDLRSSLGEKEKFLINQFWWVTGKYYSFTENHQKIDDNSIKIREHIWKYVLERKSGKRKSDVRENVDLLTLFF